MTVYIRPPKLWLDLSEDERKYILDNLIRNIEDDGTKSGFKMQIDNGANPMMYIATNKETGKFIGWVSSLNGQHQVYVGKSFRRQGVANKLCEASNTRLSKSIFRFKGM